MATKKNLSKTRVAHKRAKAASIASSPENLRKRRAAKTAANAKLKRKSASKKKVAKKAVSNKKAASKVAKRTSQPAKPKDTKAAAPAADAGSKDAAAKPQKVTTQADEKKPKPEKVTAVELGELETVTVPVKFLIAALSVAPKDDVRFMLNGVYFKQTADKLLRMVCTDGHRLFVCNVLLEEKVSWAMKGLIVPREHLERVVKYIGRKTEKLEIAFGENHSLLTVTEIDGIGVFKFRPVDGKYPNYQQVIDSAAHVFSEEREAMSITTVDAGYLKGAGVIAASLGSEGVIPFLSCDGKTASVFAFSDVPEALLYIMPLKARDEVLPAATVKLFGKPAMTATLAALDEQIKRTKTNAKTAKHKKFRDLFDEKATRLQGRADQLRAALSVKLTAPKPVEETQAEPPKADEKKQPVSASGSTVH